MTQEPATASRKPDTGPLAPPPAPSADSRRPRRLWRWAALVLVAALIAGAVVWVTRPPDPMQDPRPVEVVKGFVAAVEARDATAMLAYIEPTIARREISPEVRAYMAYVERISFSDSRYALLDNDGDRAHVRWTATMDYQVRELGGGQRAIDTTFELRKIEGRWYLHSVQLPETEGAG